MSVHANSRAKYSTEITNKEWIDRYMPDPPDCGSLREQLAKAAAYCRTAYPAATLRPAIADYYIADAMLAKFDVSARGDRSKRGCCDSAEPHGPHKHWASCPGVPK